MSEPLRTCIGCRTRDTQRNLLRIARSCHGHSPRILVDAHGTLPGRGAWLHPVTHCLEQAVRRNAFARAFKTAVDASTASMFAEHAQPYLVENNNCQPRVSQTSLTAS